MPTELFQAMTIHRNVLKSIQPANVCSKKAVFIADARVATQDSAAMVALPWVNWGLLGAGLMGVLGRWLAKICTLNGNT